LSLTDEFTSFGVFTQPHHIGMRKSFLIYGVLIWVGVPPIYWTASTASITTNDVEALAIALIHSTVLYAGTRGDGVFRSTDHGATWEPTNTGITQPLHVQNGLAVNPVTPTILYVGDFYGDGLYRSEDGSDSWSLSLPGAYVRAVAVHPTTPTIVLAGDWQQGLYRTGDDGDNWSPITDTTGFSDPGVRDLAFAPSAPDTVYAGASEFVFRSDSAGLTWTVSSTLPSNVYALAVHPITSSLVYAGTYADGLHRSEDGGASWTQLSNGLPAGDWVTSIAIHPITPSILYAGTWEGEVYQTVDGGDSWTGLDYLGYVYDVLVHPQAPSVIYAATSNNGIFRGSTLDHLTMEPVDDPQYVRHSFLITVTARDELGFPLTGTSSANVRKIAGADAALAKTLAASGYDGIATLIDRTETITPTQVTFVDGIAVAEVTVMTQTVSDLITATISGGPSVTSNPFDVVWTARLYLPMVKRD
jgi:photosystem II stability/assembly factor-like uncharacterized protein